MKALSLALLSAVVAAPATGAEAPVRSVDRAYFASAQALGGQGAQPAAVQRPAAAFSLLLTDVDIRRAFERWGRERGVAVRWLVERDHLIDAGAGRVELREDVLGRASAEGSADPELVAAMAQVAWSLRRSKHPFVIREHDNVIVVQPMSDERE